MPQLIIQPNSQCTYFVTQIYIPAVHMIYVCVVFLSPAFKKKKSEIGMVNLVERIG